MQDTEDKIAVYDLSRYRCGTQRSAGDRTGKQPTVRALRRTVGQTDDAPVLLCGARGVQSANGERFNAYHANSQ